MLVYNACIEYTMASHFIKSPMGHDVHVCIEDHSYTSLGHYKQLYANVPTNAQLTDYTRNCNIFHASEYVRYAVVVIDSTLSSQR